MEPVDLTLEISKELPSFPGSPRPMFIPWAEKKSDGYDLEMIFLSSHSGTHLDAPSHFVKNGMTIDRVPLGRLITSAFLCDVERGRDGLITRRDQVKFEERNGRIPPNSAIIFRTGWSANPSRKDYFSRNPGLAADGARYLSGMRPGLVGIDSPSIDRGVDSKFSSHHILLAKDILILENLCNLGKIRGRAFMLVVLPLKLRGATGSPARAVAI